MSDPADAPREVAELPLPMLAGALDAFLSKTGADAPPGYARATPDQNWARDHQEEILVATADLCHILYPAGLPAPGGILNPSRHGLVSNYRIPPTFRVPWSRLYETFTAILDRWGFAFVDGKLHVVREPDPDSDVAAVRPRGTALVVFPISGTFMIPFPLDVTDEEHDALRWIRKSLEAMPTMRDPKHRSLLTTRLHLIHRAALDLYAALDRDGSAWEAYRTCGLEEGFAPKVIALADALATIGRDEQVGRRAARALEALRGWFDDLLDRWGWRWILGPDRESYMAGRRAAFRQEIERPLLEAALSWAVGGRGLDFPVAVDQWADEAEGRGYEPTITPEQAREGIVELEHRRRTALLFGAVRPTCNGEDLDTLRRAARQLAVAWDSDDPVVTSLVASGISQQDEPAQSPPARVSEAESPTDQSSGLVTLDQAAGIVNRSKRALENYKGRKSMPKPHIVGGGGKPHFYAWSEMRPWLAKTFGMPNLPEQFPRFRDARRS